MDYELAKQLKEAGFPQREVRFKGTEAIRDMLGPDEPTLDELIEACGKELKGKENFRFTLRYETTWVASYTWYEEDELSCEGSTPEEAVTKLWLALNKK
jgi:hypothetical protein